MRPLFVIAALVLGLAGCGIDTAKDEHERFMSTSTTSKYWAFSEDVFNSCYRQTLGLPGIPDLSTAVAWNKTYASIHGEDDVHACLEGVRAACYWASPCRPAKAK